MNRAKQLLNKSLATVAIASLLAIGGAAPATAKSENRIRTEAIDLFVPKTIKAPKVGCSMVPVRFEWRYYINEKSTLAIVSLETRSGHLVGDLYLEPENTEEEGTAALKICSSRWVGEEEVIDGKLVEGTLYFGVKKGRHVFDLFVADFDNQRNGIQTGKKPVRLR